jgi:hypothetical protein
MWNCHQAATSESVEDFLCAVVAAILGAYESVTYKTAVNPVINLNPVFSHQHMTV